MLELPEQVDLKKLGIAQLIMRNNKAAIYKRGQNIFEVFKRKHRNARTANFNGKVVKYEAGEVYPSNEDFGLWAWCYTKLEDAERKFLSLED